MHRTQKYSFFVYFETVFVYFETPWAMNRHFMSKKKRAHSGDLTLTVAALDDTTRRILTIITREIIKTNDIRHSSLCIYLILRHLYSFQLLFIRHSFDIHSTFIRHNSTYIRHKNGLFVPNTGADWMFR